MSHSTVYLNGQFTPLSEARISVMDRGFLFGDSVYEVIPAYGGHLFRLAQHLRRLDESLHAIHMSNPMTGEEWETVLTTLIAERASVDQSVYLQVTRGVVDARDHAMPENIEPTVFAISNPVPPPDPQKNLPLAAAARR